MRKVLVCLLTLALVLGCMSVQAEGVLTPGTYTSTMTAMHGPMTVEVDRDRQRHHLRRGG